ncbi:MAG: DUF308 domain-containing protein [Lachnospiraceae bacterium]
MSKKESILSALVSVILGIMLITMKGKIISIAITVLGVGLLLSAALDFFNKATTSGIIKAVAGVCVLVFGWMFINLALYILAAALLLIGLLQIAGIRNYTPINLSFSEKFIVYCKPAATVIAGACLLLNQGGTIAWVFIATGVLLIIEGVLEIANALR